MSKADWKKSTDRSTRSLVVFFAGLEKILLLKVNVQMGVNAQTSAVMRPPPTTKPTPATAVFRTLSARLFRVLNITGTMIGHKLLGWDWAG